MIAWLRALFCRHDRQDYSLMNDGHPLWRCSKCGKEWLQ